MTAIVVGITLSMAALPTPTAAAAATTPSQLTVDLADIRLV